MKSRIAASFILALVCFAAGTACQTTGRTTQSAPRSSAERQLAETRALLGRYEERYGKLPALRAKHDFRKLKAELKGKPMTDVTARLGKPDRVFSIGATESWDYSDAAYDPVSGRTVRNLEVWFKAGVVDYMNATY